MTQLQRVESALRKGPLTTLQAVQRFGCLRLSERVRELKARGLRIRTELVEVRNRFGERTRVARYRLG